MRAGLSDVWLDEAMVAEGDAPAEIRSEPRCENSMSVGLGWAQDGCEWRANPLDCSYPARPGVAANG